MCKNILPSQFGISKLLSLKEQDMGKGTGKTPEEIDALVAAAGGNVRAVLGETGDDQQQRVAREFPKVPKIYILQFVNINPVEYVPFLHKLHNIRLFRTVKE